MGDKMLYQKLFLMFNQEDSGFGSGQNPSGYTKIEARDGKVKLSAVVQNLKDDNGRIEYMLYLLEKTADGASPVLVGQIPLNKNQGELKQELKSGGIGGLRGSAGDIVGAAVIAQYKDRENTSIMCPLTAYKDKKLVWRDKLKDLHCSKDKVDAYNKENKSEDIVKQDVYSKFEGKLESIHKQERKDIQPEIGNIEKSFIDESDTIIKDSLEESFKLQNGDIKIPGKEETSGDISRNEEEQKQDDKENLQEYPGEEEYKKLFGEKTYDNTLLTGERDNVTCVYKQDNNCPYIKSDADSNLCADCFMQSSMTQKENTNNKPGDVTRLSSELDRFFEICDPFRSRRRDYKWWKANTPVQLNNVLHQCNIKTPVLFNPKILMAHFKYRHLILGIYTDTIRNKEYVVFGVPGVYSIDEKPFRDMCRWAQVEGNRPRYGAFGYWLVYIDPITGRMV